MHKPRKFVVFSHGRAGTNFLMKNLAAHPNVKSFMEPFHNDPKGRSRIQHSAWKNGESSRSFAYDIIYGKRPERIHAVGFKLFYFHCRQSKIDADIWDALREDTEVHAIFLNRRNLLNKHLSDLRAVASGVWHPNTDDYMGTDYKAVIDIEVKLDQALRVMSDLYCGYHRIADQFGDHPNRHYFYEDLENNSENILADVFEFLGVAAQDQITSPFRTGTLSRETTRITNEKALREGMQSTIFADFVDTCPLL